MTMLNPETRASLILRLGDPEDHVAWAEFMQIYEPLLLRLATRWGLQHALHPRNDAAAMGDDARPARDRDDPQGCRAISGWARRRAPPRSGAS